MDRYELIVYRSVKRSTGELPVEGEGGFGRDNTYQKCCQYFARKVFFYNDVSSVGATT